MLQKTTILMAVFALFALIFPLKPAMAQKSSTAIAAKTRVALPVSVTASQASRIASGELNMVAGKQPSTMGNITAGGGVTGNPCFECTPGDCPSGTTYGGCGVCQFGDKLLCCAKCGWIKKGD